MKLKELIWDLEQIASYCHDDNDEGVHKAAKMADKLVKKLKKEGVENEKENK